MKLRSITVERNLRRRIRQEVALSEAPWKEYQAGWRAQRWRALGLAIIALFMSFCFVTTPIIFNIIFIGFGLVAPPERGPAREGNGTELSLSIQALFLMGFALMTGSEFLEELLRSRDVGVLSYLPLSDTDFYRRQRNRLMVHVIFAFYLVTLGYGYFAWADQFPLEGWLAATALAFLQGLMFIAIPLLLPVRRPTRFYALVGIGAFGLASFAGLVGFMLKPYVEGHCWPAFILLPTGWINGAFYYGLVQREAVGWLLLVPTFGVLALAARRACLPFAIKEFSYLPGGGAQAILENHGWWVRRTPQASLREAEAPSAEEIETRLRHRTFLRDWNEQDVGWIERTLARWSSKRERALITFLFGLPPRWSLAWKRSALWMTGCAALLAVPFPTEVHMFLVLPMTLLSCIFFAQKQVDQSQGDIPPYALFPAGYREISVTLIKAAVVRCLPFLPLGAGCGALAAWRLGYPATEGVLFILKAFYFSVPTELWFITFFFANGTNDTAHVRRRIWLMALIGILGCIHCVGGLLLFFAPALLQLLGAVMVVACPAVMWRYYEHVLYAVEVDWIRQDRGRR